MASLKAEKPASADLSGQTKKEPTKPSSTAPKAAGSKPAPKKSEQKPAGGSKKKAAAGKAKN